MNKGLGRGLGSLFSAYDSEDDDKPIEKEQKTTEILNNNPQEIDIGLIDRNTNQPRKIFNEEALLELSQSIKVHGVIQPIIVVKKDNRYMIVSGERRWRASKLAGLKTIPAIVRNYTNSEIAEISLIENLQREDLNPIESAKAIKELIDKFNLTQESIAERIGKSRSAVTNTLRLLSLSKQVIKMIEEGKLSAGHGKILVAVENTELQEKIATMAVEAKLSVRELEKYLQSMANKHEKTSNSKNLSYELMDFTKILQEKLATKVFIKGNDTKGRITIEYYSKDDLNRLYDILK